MPEQQPQWALFFRTKFGDAATPFKCKKVPVGGEQYMCLAIVDVKNYGQDELDRCYDLLFRIFPDYEHRHGLKRDGQRSENWNLEWLWGHYV